MVNITSINESNAHFASEHHAGLICVFVGATSGIGASTIESMAKILEAPTFYILGRSETRFAAQKARLESLNPSTQIIFIEAEVSLLSDIDAACERIGAAERKIDILYMSQGCVPLNGPVYTQEGLETCFSLSYYSRMRLLQNFLPLLRQSPYPHVLSVLNAGREKGMVDDDLGLKANWSVLNVINHTTNMNSLAMEYLAGSEENKNITFIHAGPGRVRTDIFSKLAAPKDSGLVWRVLLLLIQGIVKAIYWFDGIEVEESGRRQAFHLVSKKFGPGAWRVDELSEVVVEQGVLGRYSGDEWLESVWDHTLGVFEADLGARAMLR